MTSSFIDGYLERLRLELRVRFITDDRVIEEVRGHLDDAIETARGEGMASADAEARALARVGAPAVVAAACAADRTRMWHGWLLALAAIVGAAIAYVDSRPNWDDTGITAGALAMTAGLFGLLGPRHAWRWALAIGLWIPAAALVRTPTPASLAMLLVLAFPLAGAWSGRAIRRLIA